MLKAGRNQISVFIAFLSIFFCFCRCTTVPGDDTGDIIKTPENVPSEGCFWDEESSTLFCNGKAIGRSALQREACRLHPYPKFLSLVVGEQFTLFYEGRVSWERIWMGKFEKSAPDSSLSVINPYIACDRTRTYFVGRDRTGPLPNAPYLIFSFLPLEGNPAANTLTVLPDPRYIKSPTMVYYYGQPVAGADPQSFVTLSQDYPSMTHTVYNLTMQDFEYYESFEGIAADGKHVFIGGRIVNEIKTGLNFRLLSRYWIVTDDAVFDNSSYKLNKVKAADPLSIRMLGTYYSSDKDSVFYLATEMKADSASFQEIDRFYGRDKKSVFYCSVPVPGGDPDTFQSIGRGYAKDARYVYLRGVQIEQADPAGFELYTISQKYKEILLYSYYRTDDDFCLAHDEKRVYFGTKAIWGADPKSFQPEKYFIEQIEKEHKRIDDLYRRGKIVF